MLAGNDAGFFSFFHLFIRHFTVFTVTAFPSLRKNTYTVDVQVSEKATRGGPGVVPRGAHETDYHDEIRWPWDDGPGCCLNRTGQPEVSLVVCGALWVRLRSPPPRDHFLVWFSVAWV